MTSEERLHKLVMLEIQEDELNKEISRLKRAGRDDDYMRDLIRQKDDIHRKAVELYEE